MKKTKVNLIDLLSLEIRKNLWAHLFYSKSSIEIKYLFISSQQIRGILMKFVKTLMITKVKQRYRIQLIEKFKAMI